MVSAVMVGGRHPARSRDQRTAGNGDDGDDAETRKGPIQIPVSAVSLIDWTRGAKTDAVSSIPLPPAPAPSPSQALR
ncbi:hypothetical protein QR685DRAFT_571223 [Neurospora intermedia]|uniref:Uncharacterized protein n=1 Tax=Neurospora intermedia TaxID=5142 RepID=A0ABR3DJ01_NEUIN